MAFPKYFIYGPVADQEGIQLHYVNQTSWDDIISARRYDFWGLPYIIIKRNCGLWRMWLIPLFWLNWKKFKDSVEKHCPKEHPFRTAMLSYDGPSKYSFIRMTIIFSVIGSPILLFFVIPLCVYLIHIIKVYFF